MLRFSVGGALLLAVSTTLSPSPGAASGPAAPPVIAIVSEVGANLLHKDFQVAQPVAQLAGAPRAEQVRLPGAGDFAGRLAEAQAGPLGAVPPGRLLHVVGTNVFVYNASDVPQDVLEHRSHGTGVLGAAASARSGSAPGAAYVLVLGSEEGWAWVAEQSWIEVASSSFYSIGADCETGPEVRRAASSGQLLFAAAGNNTTAELAFAPAGLPEVIRVGGVDAAGRTSPMSTHPYEVGDQFVQQLPGPDGNDGLVASSGTSYAAPRAAGRAGLLVQAARKVLGDTRSGVRRGNLAVAPRPTDVRRGPLADGLLGAEEMRRLLQVTATPHEAEADDRYFREGFGALGPAQARLALSILRGQGLAAERAPETADHDTYLFAASALTPEARCGPRTRQE